MDAFKTALAELGVIASNTMRAPMAELDAAEAAKIREILVETGPLAVAAREVQVP